MDTSTFLLNFFSLAVFSTIVWLIALIHAATNANFKDSTSKLIWVLIIIFTNGIGGILYLLFGRPKEQKTSSKTPAFKKLLLPFGGMPLGLKILTLLNIYYLVHSFLNFGKLFEPANFMGIQLHQPIATIYNLGYLLINVLILISLFKRYAWGWKLWIVSQTTVLGAFIILILPQTISALLSPPNEIYTIIDLTTTPEYQNAASYSATRFTIISVNLAMLVFMFLMTAYLYKKKDYFSK